MSFLRGQPKRHLAEYRFCGLANGRDQLSRSSCSGKWVQDQKYVLKMHHDAIYTLRWKFIRPTPLFALSFDFYPLRPTYPKRSYD